MIKKEFIYLLIYSLPVFLLSYTDDSRKSVHGWNDGTCWAEIVDVEDPVVVYMSDTAYITSYSYAKDTSFREYMIGDVYEDIPFNECALRYFGDVCKDNLVLYVTDGDRSIYRFKNSPDGFMLVLVPENNVHVTLEHSYTEDGKKGYDRCIAKGNSRYCRMALPVSSLHETGIPDKTRWDRCLIEPYHFDDAEIVMPKVVECNGREYVVSGTQLNVLIESAEMQKDSLERFLWNNGYVLESSDFLETDGTICGCQVYRFKLVPKKFSISLSPVLRSRYCFGSGFDAYCYDYYSTLCYEKTAVPVFGRWDMRVGSAIGFYYMRYLTYEDYLECKHYDVWHLFQVIFKNSMAYLLVGAFLVLMISKYRCLPWKSALYCVVMQVIIAFILIAVACTFCLCDIWKAAVPAEILALTAIGVVIDNRSRNLNDE